MKKSHIVLLCTFMILSNACKSSMHGDPQRDWQADATFFASTDEKAPNTYYKPYAGYVGDPMPFYDPQSASFKVLYLLDYRPNPVGTYHPIWGVETKDAANYISINEVLSCGGLNEQDAALGTGSVIFNEDSKTYYLFYTGHRHQPQAGEAVEAVMMATSSDFVTWQKSKTFLLFGGDYGYSNQNFRDPFVLKMEDGKWHMIISTTQNGKGSLVEFVSEDLLHWSHVGVFMTMMWDRFYECPDLFKMGDWWYLVYSEMHAGFRRVQYFKGRTIDELKACTVNDAGRWPDAHEGFLNSRAYYAGKTATDGIHRYMWGWVPTRDGESNTATAPAPAEPNWAGTLVAHKVLQNPDGTLTLVEVPAMEQKYKMQQDVVVKEQSDSVTVQGGVYTLPENSYVLFSRLGYHSRISCTVTTAEATDKFGISLCRGTDSEKYYTMIINPESASLRKVNFEEEGPKGMGFVPAIDSYTFSTPADNTYHITLITDNSVVTLYINDVLAYTNRIYQQQRNPWSINCYGGSITVSDLKISTY